MTGSTTVAEQILDPYGAELAGEEGFEPSIS